MVRTGPGALDMQAECHPGSLVTAGSQGLLQVQ